MEIRYKRTYLPSKGKRYTAGEIQAMLGYAIEAADPRVPLKEGKLAPGEICMMLFGITPEEYGWKDGDPRALDALAEKLCREIPADRIIGWRVCDLKGATVQKAVQLSVGASIDGGAFAERVKEKLRAALAGPIDQALMECRGLQKQCADKNVPEGVRQDWIQARAELGRAILGLEKLYVTDEVLVDGRWPAVGLDGRIEIFTTRERAERTKAQITAANAGVELWSVREIEGAEIGNFLRRCAVDGLDALRVDNGFITVDLNLKDFMGDISGENMPLRGFMIREIEFGVRWNKLKEVSAPEKNLRGALESMLTLRNFAWREIGNASLYAVCAGDSRDKCVLLGGRDGGGRMLAVFTDRIRAAAFAERMEGNPKPVEMKFDELALRASAVDGLLIDFGTVSYRLPKTEFEKVKELRSKPPMVVRIQPPKAEEEAPAVEAPAPKKAEASAGSLPNPDDFDLPARPAADEPQTAPAGPDKPETPQKKGFFKKLFGK